MSEVLLLTGVTAVGFAATNVDSLMLLVSLLSGHETRRRNVFVGYGLSVLVVLAMAWFAAQIGDWIPPRATNFLGLVPIAMGLRELITQLRASGGDPTPRAGPESTSAVALLMLSISSDNFGVFIPLFAETPKSLDHVILVAGLGATLI